MQEPAAITHTIDPRHAEDHTLRMRTDAATLGPPLMHSMQGTGACTDMARTVKLCCLAQTITGNLNYSTVELHMPWQEQQTEQYPQHASVMFITRRTHVARLPFTY